MTMITRDDRPPARKDTLWVQCLKPGVQERFTIYSTQFQGIWTHWNGNRTAPCYHDRTKCFKGHDEASKRWLGYLHGFSRERNQPAFLQVPAASAREFLEQFKAGTPLRGFVIDVVRRGTRKQSPLAIAVNENIRRKADDLPPVRDCLKSCLHLWKVFDVDYAVHTALVAQLEDIPIEDAA